MCTPVVQPDAVKKELKIFKGHFRLCWRKRRVRRDDELKDEIKKRAASEEEEKGPKPEQGEGERRFCILMLKLQREVQQLAVQFQPPPDKMVPDQETCSGEAAYAPEVD